MDAAAFSVSPLPELRLFSTLPDRSVSTFHRHKLADTEFHWSHPRSLSPSVFLIDPHPQFTLGKIEEKGRGRGDARVEGRYSSRVFRFVGRKGVVHGSVNFIGLAKWFPSKCWVFDSEREDYRPRVSIVIQRCSLLAGREERFEKKGRCIESLEKISLYPIPFPKKRKKERKESHLFSSSPIPFRWSTSARRGQLSLKPPLYSPHCATLGQRNDATRQRENCLALENCKQEGGERTVCTRISPGGLGENCRADTIHICREIYRLDRRSSPGKYTYPDLSRPWTNTYALIRRPDYDFFLPPPRSQRDSSLVQCGF